MKTAEKSTKVAEKRAENKAKNSKKIAKVTFLKEGVTGKDLMKSQIASNNAHKKDMGSFSQCLKRAIAFDDGFISSMKLTKADLAPKNLLTFLSDGEKLRQKARKDKGLEPKFSVWGVQMLIKRAAKK